MNKILILSTAKNYGGAEKSIENVIEEIKKIFNILVGVTNKEYGNLFEKRKIEIFYLKKNKLFILYNIFILYFIVKQYNIVIANTNKDAFYLAILSFFMNLNKKNIVIYIRDYQWKYRKFIYKRLCKVKYILPTKALLEDSSYIEKYIEKKHLYIIGEPVKINNNSEYNDGKYILLLANISRLKGIDLLLKAYVQSEVSKKNIKVLICGKIQDKVYFKELLDYIRENNIESMIEIKDFQNDEQIKILYENSLMVINSSISQYGGPETFGRTIIEAWSYKKPVIAFNVGGPKYIIDNGINGFLVEEKNVKELAEKINLLSNNSNLCKIFGNNGYNKVCFEYTTEIIVKKLIKCLKEKID